MWPYLLLAAYTGFLWMTNRHGLVDRKAFLFLALVPACMLLALRGPAVGEDTSMYLDMAAVACGMPWEEFSNLHASIIWNMNEWGYGSSVNVGYLLLCKLVVTFAGSAVAVQIVCAIVTCWCVGRFIYKNTENVGLAYWVFLCGGMYMFAFNGMRQMLALALAVQAFACLKEKRFIPVLVWIALGSLIHTSALAVAFLLVIYILLKKQIILKPILLTCLLFPLLIPLLEVLAGMISAQYATYFQKNYWDASVGGVVLIWVFIVMSLLVVCAKDKTHNGRFVASSAAIYISLSIMSLSISIFERVALYPQLFSILLYPCCLESLSEKNRWWYNAVTVVLFFLLFVSYAMSPARSYSMFL